MERLKVLIIEDELIIAEKTKMILEEIGYEVVALATNFDEAISAFTTQSPDILIVDINLDGDKDGVDVVQELRKNNTFKAIFVTSYSDNKTVEKVKHAQPDAYLLKPFGKQDLFTTIEVVAASIEQKPKESTPEQVYIKSNNAILRIDLSEVVAVKSDDVYCVIMMSSGKEHLLRESMKQMDEKLGDDFIRIHKSYIVPFKKIDQLVYDSVMIGEHKFPIGRTYREGIMSKLNML